MSQEEPKDFNATHDEYGEYAHDDTENEVDLNQTLGAN